MHWAKWLCWGNVDNLIRSLGWILASTRVVQTSCPIIQVKNLAVTIEPVHGIEHPWPVEKRLPGSE